MQGSTSRFSPSLRPRRVGPSNLNRRRQTPRLGVLCATDSGRPRAARSPLGGKGGGSKALPREGRSAGTARASRRRHVPGGEGAARVVVAHTGRRPRARARPAASGREPFGAYAAETAESEAERRGSAAGVEEKREKHRRAVRPHATPPCSPTPPLPHGGPHPLTPKSRKMYRALSQRASTGRLQYRPASLILPPLLR